MTPLAQKALALAGTWSRPPDVAAEIAAGLAGVLALLALFGRGRGLLGLVSESPASPAPSRPSGSERRRFLSAVALLASLLSLAYIAVYLRGGPRIVDATSYFLQGRVLSRGDFAWAPLEPSASFRGRFLLFDGDPAHPSLGGIFPPGYPLLLAFGFMLGAPMIVGPVLAGALVVATYYLARTIAEESALDPRLAEPIARAAGLLSLVCAALRYHTADTMSHGAAALGITVALTCALRAAREGARTAERAGAAGAPPRPVVREESSPFDEGRGFALLTGLALGYVLATRPVSMLPIGIVAVALLLRTPRLLGWTAAGVLPGLLLLLVAQHEVTGAWMASSQRVYYAVSDGPPGCFRWGFGRGIGCLFEHGDFVHARLEHGYGLLEAVGTTLRRLHHHLLDVANLEPLALLVLLPALQSRRAPKGRRVAVRAATALVGLQILAYAPFYFDGDYPGGGARFFADVLPTEHALVVLALAGLGARFFSRAAYAVLAAAAAGFAVHASFEHGKLRDRDGGRPMFERDPFAAANITHGLVFVETDHGFALGHDPAARPDRDLVVARFRGDDRDRMVYEALGRPPTYLYKYDASATASATVPGAAPSFLAWTPTEFGTSLRFEGEAEWPPLAQAGGFAVPMWAGGCASGTRVLVLTPTHVEASGSPPPHPRPARVTITVPVRSAGRWSIEPHVVSGVVVPFAPAAEEPVEGALAIVGQRWTWRPGASCITLPPKEMELSPPSALVTLEATGGPVSLDYLVLRKL